MKDIADLTIAVIDHGTFAPIAHRLARDAKRVLYHIPEREGFETFAKFSRGFGHEDIELCSDFWPIKKEIDLFVFPDCADAGLQLELESQGFPIWGTKDVGTLETMRGEWLQACEALGLPLPKTHVIRGLTNLRLFLDDHEGEEYYVKISRFRGDCETFKVKEPSAVRNKLDCLALKFGPFQEHITFYVQEPVDTDIEGGADTYFVNGQWPSKVILGYERKGESYFATWKEREKMPPEIWKVSEAMTDLLASYRYCNLVSTEVRVKGDQSYLLDPCFSADTEILTDDGWKLFPELLGTEKVATLNTGNGQIEYHCPTNYLRQRYSGKMVKITNREKSIECLVTPNHGVWRTDRHKKGLFVERADSLSDSGFIPRTGKWSAPELTFFVLPQYKHSWDSGRYQRIHKTKDCPPLSIPMDDWLAFIALYLSEGSQGTKWHINIAQRKHRQWAQDIVSRLPFTWAENEGGFVVHSVQLSSYLKQFGLCSEKWIPRYVGNCSPRQIRIFLDAYALGDGGVHGKGMRYFSTSRRMADGLQELVFKAGGLATIRTHMTKGTPMSCRGKTYVRNHNMHVVFETFQSFDFWFETQKRKSLYITDEDYDGWVYDVTVKNHTVFVRRNGNPFWSSNCLRMPSPAGEEELEMYANFTEIVYRGAMGEMVEPEMAAKFCGEAVIEYSGDKDGWKSIRIPEEVQQWVKLYACGYENGAYHFPPAQDPEAIGCIVGLGDTPEEVLDRLKEVRDALKDSAVDIHIEPIAELFKEVEKAESVGIPFSSGQDMPEPAKVLE